MVSDVIVIKVGTHVVTENGRVNEERLRRLVSDIDGLLDDGRAVVLVSSGAVAAALDCFETHATDSEVERRQVASAVGQVRLMQTYQALFSEHNRVCAQVLATRSDFRDRQHYLNMQRCLHALLARGIVPVVNENDVVAVTELMFTDNDELAGLLAAMLGASRLFLLSNVPGVLDENGEVIADWQDSAARPMAALPTHSDFGRGGIHTKLRIARRAASLGTETWIADGRQGGVVPALLAATGQGTRFRAERSASSVKRWVASSRGHEKGDVLINAGAARALRDPERLASLLPVGVAAVRGDFEKGDIVRIETDDGELVGWGRAQYGAEAARQHLGQHGAKALVHYDYLHIESP
ncbi:MAG: glutamate 5-kinase [Xanthomonadales bacterium]|nr:glutamate 5-kinase [Xanthomonadales bacterium]